MTHGNVSCSVDHRGAPCPWDAEPVGDGVTDNTPLLQARQDHPTVTLDEAWREAEDVAGPCCRLAVWPSIFGYDEPKRAYFAQAKNRSATGYGPTPTAALQALTAALRGSTESSGA